MSLYKSKAVYATNERQYLATGGEAQAPKGGWLKVEREDWHMDVDLRELYRSVVTKLELSNKPQLLVSKLVFVPTLPMVMNHE